jgi:hypothetical protein
MNFGELKKALAGRDAQLIRFRFVAGGEIEIHCHVTEIGKVTKDFVDCGGVRRTVETCVIQTFVYSDTDHRVTANTFSKIVKASGPLGLSDDLPVDVEYQTSETIGVFSVSEVTCSDEEVSFSLASKATACLAPDLCGIDGPNSSVANLSSTKPSALPQLPGGC